MKEYTIQKTGYIMRYHDFEGNDIPILFIHGLGCAGSYDYPNVASHHALQNHRCIIVDLLGFGYSDKPEDFTYSVEDHANYLIEFIKALNLNKFILFGHSLGGAVALSLADKCREKIHQIILTEPNLDKSEENSTSKYISEFEMQSFIEKGFYKLISASRRKGNGIWAACLSVSLPKAVYFISKSAALGANPSWREIFYSLKCPKTFIYGEKSLPDDDMPILESHGIKVDIVENAGHSMAWENPQGLAEAICRSIDFIK